MPHSMRVTIELCCTSRGPVSRPVTSIRNISCVPALAPLRKRFCTAELRAESEELYHAAIKIDYSFVPTYFEGPKVTPPIKEHVATDGEYVDTTRKY